MTALATEPLTELIKTIPGYDPYRDIHCPETGEVLYYFDEEEAQFRIDFIEECCTFTDGQWAGRPFILVPWQKAVIANMFGWKRVEDGLRRYKEILIYVPRKNGKTETIAAIANCVMFTDDEPGAQIHSAASTLDQANIVFEASKRMIRNEPEMAENCDVAVTKITMPHPMNTVYRPVCANPKGLHGLKTHLALIDEVHAHDNPDLIAVLLSAMKMRAQPLIIYTTTADYDRPSICNDILKTMKGVRDGTIRLDNHLPVIYEASIDDDWEDPEVWRMANPNFGVSVIERNFKEEFEKAKAMPSYENEFKRLALNIKTQQANRWIPMPAWDACCEKFDRTEMIEKLRGRPCYAGLDLASTIDTACFNLIFPEDDFVILPFFWVPALGSIEKEKTDKVPYSMWARDGYIERTSGLRIDHKRITSKVVELSKIFNIKMIAFDRWSADDVYNELAENHGLPLFRHGQGYKDMSEPTKRLEMAIMEGKINHGHNPVMRWMMGNVMVKSDEADGLKIDKAKSSHKVDGPVALVMAFNCHIIQDIAKASYLNRRELRVLE